ncbi:MAG: hypothetical protein ACJAT7_001008 [Psychromonas sp.]|jgi:hypothetical protein|uniref:hypothetical protein n=1 Tax=Psychromonas sp. TaxID=1884585 RepID=UPI0039E62AC7
MKLNKLVIAMGLASAVLTGCGSDNTTTPVPVPTPETDFSITAIDGYIVHGLVTATCNDIEYTARTNESGVAAILADGSDISDCTAEITGDAETRDLDAPDVAWLHTMATLKGLSVINPYTDVAAVIFANNPALSTAEVMDEVFTLLNITPDVVAGGVNLFADYGANNVNSGLDTESLAKISVLAHSTFSAIVKLKAALPANATPAQAKALYAAVLPKVTAMVAAKITELGQSNLAGKVFVAEFKLPTLKFNEDGTLKNHFSDLIIELVELLDSTATGTGTGTGTGTDGVGQG